LWKIHFPNSRMRSVPFEGGIMEILSRALELERQGRSIIHMEIGRPDFNSPECARNGAIEALRAGDVHYTDINGKKELREAIARKYRRENRLEVNPDTQVIVTAGATEALMITFMSVLEPGDEVIIPAPFFPAYTDQVNLSNGIVKPVPCTMENEFRLKVQDIRDAITEKTRILLINSPNNPTGAVLTREDLEEIARLAVEEDLLVISDECYEKFLYEGEHVSIASLPGMAERTVTIGAASKTWSMTGWRIGWAIVPPEMKKYATKCHQNLTTCGNAFAQAGVAKAFREADGDVKRMIDEYRRRRDLVMSYLNRIEGFEAVTPHGAFYAFPSVKKLGLSPFELSSYLLEEAGVATVPSDVFRSEGFIRIAYCRSYEEIEEGMKRIEAAVAKLRK